MLWFILALCGPLLWSFVNHIDKYILSRHLRGGGVGALIIFSCLFSIVIIPILIYLRPQFILVDLLDGAALLLGGILSAVGMLLYLLALQKEEASKIVPLFQLSPVIALIFGYFIFKETITVTQSVGVIVILFGAMIISMKRDINFSNRIQINWRPLILMSGSSICFIFHAILFKIGAIGENDFWLGLLWEHIGILFTGVFLFVFIGSLRRDFLNLFRFNSFPILSLNFLGEVFVLVGNACTAYAFLIVQVGLVLVVSAYQPLFVFIIGIILTYAFPKILKEDVSPRALVNKGIAVVVIIVGSFLING
ncbi:MAG: DMT family transporter [Candidatus Taylorbacteria bacterium]|nr:DMT family transporter [Candidatus Taylorbacteria bacterium]